MSARKVLRKRIKIILDELEDVKNQLVHWTLSFHKNI